MDYQRIDAKTIRAAKAHDTEAWDKILCHYRPYIMSCCKNTYLDKYGNICSFIDEDMVKQVENELMLKVIMSFNVNKLPKEMLDV